ncbi:MAG TPA: inorganic phosphate transporter [Bacteroidetes bacterium]|nr:inorganic phosphate transporter [Bacteroidota bacterium]
MNIGGNDVANAMGTSVGSRALTFRQAVIVAAFFEFAGAVLVGSHVTETIRKGIINPEHFAAQPELLALGMFSALLAAGIWLQIATSLGLPVSTTHSIVGAVMGFGILANGFGSVEWGKVSEIVLSWLISPLAGGAIAYFVFRHVSKRILDAERPMDEAIGRAPYLAFFVFFILILSFIYKGLKNLHLNLPLHTALLWAFGVAMVGSLVVRFIMRRLSQHEKDPIEFVENIFKYLQIMTACYVAFAHGANDVANSVGPLSAIIHILSTHTVKMQVEVPLWILMLGGGGIVLGLAIWGYNVIRTVGGKITEITPTRGFSAEFATATTVLVFSKMGLPISTTHTLVGSVIGVGFARGIAALNLRVIRDIIGSWILTLPAAALFTVIIYEIIIRILL